MMCGCWNGFINPIPIVRKRSNELSSLLVMRGKRSDRVTKKSEEAQQRAAYSLPFIPAGPSILCHQTDRF
eukprot:scaffold45382_cov59-Attheya_sp.AAC.3